MAAALVPRRTFTGVTLFKFVFATNAMLSFKNAAPVAPERRGNAIVLVTRRATRSTTATPGKLPSGTTARRSRAATETGLPSGLRPRENASCGLSTGKTVRPRSLLVTITATSCPCGTPGSTESSLHAAGPNAASKTQPHDLIRFIGFFPGDEDRI